MAWHSHAADYLPMNPRFRITIGSERDYDDLVGDIYFDDCIVCVVTQEGGLDDAQVEFFSGASGILVGGVVISRDARHGPVRADPGR
jgi:hypothetical protein